MENALKICKRLHAYLLADSYIGKIAYITATRVEIDTPFGLVSLLQRECLRPFSLLVSSLQPFSALELDVGMEVLLSKVGVDIPGTKLEIDITMAEDIDLSMESMQNLFLPVDLNIRLGHIQRVLEQCAEGDRKAMLLHRHPGDPAFKELESGLSSLSKAIEEGDRLSMAKMAAACAGRGVGKTALRYAGDDMLCGYIAGFTALSYALGRSYARVLEDTRAIAAGAAGETVATAAAALLQAGEALIDENSYQLLRCLFSDTAYTTLLSRANAIVGKEGTDYLYGLCLSIQLHYVRKAYGAP